MPASQTTVHPSLHGLPTYLQAGETLLADGPDYHSPPTPNTTPSWTTRVARLVKKKLHLAFISLKQDFQNGL